MNDMRKLIDAAKGLDEEYSSNELSEAANRLELAYEDFYATAKIANPEFAEDMNRAAGEVFNQVNKILEYR